MANSAKATRDPLSRAGALDRLQNSTCNKKFGEGLQGPGLLYTPLISAFAVLHPTEIFPFIL